MRTRQGSHRSVVIQLLSFLLVAIATRRMVVESLLTTKKNNNKQKTHAPTTSSSVLFRDAARTNDDQFASRFTNDHWFQFSQRFVSYKNDADKQKSKCACPPDHHHQDNDADNDDDLLEDRREAFFAMLGGLWAAGTLPEAFLLGQAQGANAAHGTDAKLSFPDVIQGLSDRNTKQCLVESLGNRECLVYREDEEKLLYKGADVGVLLGRIQTAATALEKDIPPLVETKQWTKLTGVLTGPMGQLSSTMTLLCKLADNPSLAQQKAQKVKTDVFAMGTATTNKSGAEILKYQQLAIQDLAVFIKSL